MNTSINSDYTKDACDTCLDHAWKMGRLGPWIQNQVDDRPGNSTLDLLKLDLPELVTTVGANATVLNDNDPEEMRHQLDQTEITAICQHSSRYPGQLNDLESAPKVLFCRGDVNMLSDFDRDQMVAIVGARKATGYGLEVSAGIGRNLARDNVAVVSGMALGIDGAAHRGALESGRTIAVLPCGPDRPYPATHSRLYRQIVDRGLVISEAIPGGDAWRWSFPARNRIVAALSGTTLVVEAAWRSGSMITAHIAKDLNRQVCAVPGPVTASNAAGANSLIKTGVARLVENAADVPSIRRRENGTLDVVR